MISIIYCTNRENPMFEWFIDALYQQTFERDRQQMELIFIDYCYGFKRAKELNEINNDRFLVKHYLPKPNLYQGKKRKTTGEYFSPSNARNTGALVSTGNYIVFCDDVSLPQPGWFDAVKNAQRKNMIVCGAYQKHFDMQVENGLLLNSLPNPGGIDGRWNLGGGVPAIIKGGQMYGCSLGIPSDVLMQVNGFDELCDSIGSEDYQLGMRLNNGGHVIYYDRNMYTIESEELHNQPYLMKREDRVLPMEEYMKRLHDFGVYKRFTTGNWDSSHMILDILLGSHQVGSQGNNYSLSFFRESGVLPFEPDDTAHWFDNKPLIEMQ